MWRASSLGLLIFLALRGELLAAGPACIALRDEAVTAADLAGVQAALGTLPGQTRVAWAPAPGVTRWIPAGELARIARRFGIAVSPEPLLAERQGLCLVRLVEALDREKLLAAMHAAGPGYDIELISFGPASVPPGRLQFSSKNLPHLPRSPQVPSEMASGLPAAVPPAISLQGSHVPVIQWRGQLMSESGRAFPVWARARVSVRRSGLVARRALEVGQIVGDDAIKRVNLIDYPAWEAPLTELGLAAGRRVRRAIPALTPLLPHLLALRRDIERGDLVEVELPAGERMGEPEGEASATLTAEAESPGRTGEMILLKNPLTGRRFSSKVTAVGRAVMMPERAPARPRSTLPQGLVPKTPALNKMGDSTDAHP